MKRMNWKRLGALARDLAREHRNRLPYVIAAVVCLLIYGLSHLREKTVSVYRSEGAPDFKDARILGSTGESFFESKERLLSKTMRDVLASQATLQASNDELKRKVQELENKRQPEPKEPAPIESKATQADAAPTDSHGALLSKPQEEDGGVRVGPPPEGFEATSGASIGAPRKRPMNSGPSIISFPVKDVTAAQVEGVVLPAGSYVKAKLMTGVEAPEGKTYPVLLQLDFAYIIPNQKKIDLSGCFMIAKSQGDLSTERVQMQATKLSCVSKTGKMFEREVNGFIADDTDNSFAVIGKVNSKQDRVAAMAFLSSVVEGVGKALQMAQTSQQTNALGGSQTSVTGDQAGYIAAGGASNAASMVTQWYLKQAQNLLPTINVGSGQDVWIVMQDTAQLPNEYFKRSVKGESRESVYTYFSRLVD